MFSSTAQTENADAKLEELTLLWDGEAAKLSTYEGLTQFCPDENYRSGMIGILKGIHHYDLVLYEIISQKAHFGGNSEIKKH